MAKKLLVTNTDAPPQEVVQRYKSLADIERGFRVLKSDIKIGPARHRLPQRIRFACAGVLYGLGPCIGGCECGSRRQRGRSHQLPCW